MPTRPRPHPYRLLGPDGPYESAEPGLLGGYRPRRIFGQLDCASARRAIEKGGYVQHRVFFADEAAAWACGYRPCAKCLPELYRTWKATQPETPAAKADRLSARRAKTAAVLPRAGKRPSMG